jgi:hypothetical protein
MDCFHFSAFLFSGEHALLRALRWHPPPAAKEIYNARLIKIKYEMPA